MSFEDPSDRKSVYWGTLVVVLLILYGSLYPFHFSLPRKPLFQWGTAGGLGFIRDTAINLALYFPLGFLLFHAVAKSAGRFGRIFLAVACGAVLSSAIEYSQAFDQGRYSSSLDLAMNTAGCAFGAVAAAILKVRFRGASAIRRHPAASLLLLLALGAHLYPFFPRVHAPQFLAVFTQFSSSLAPARTTLFTTPLTTPLEIVFFFVRWLAIASLLRDLLERPAAVWELAAVMLVVPAGFLIIDQRPAATEFAGAMAALVFVALGRLAFPGKPEPGNLAPWLLLTIVAQELMPFHPVFPPRDFQWIPFSGAIEAMPLSIGTLLSKAFLYGTAIRLFAPRGKGLLPATGLVSTLLFALEWVQRYLPGRTPELTDAVLAALMGAILCLLGVGIPLKEAISQYNKTAIQQAI